MLSHSVDRASTFHVDSSLYGVLGSHVCKVFVNKNTIHSQGFLTHSLCDLNSKKLRVFIAPLP